MNERQCLRFNGKLGDDGAIFLPYQAREVNAVMGSKNGTLCEVTILQNSQPLSKDIRGEDIVHLPGGVASLFVDRPRMYQLVRNKEFGSSLLKLTTSNPNLEIYTFSFTTCVIPELISTN
jgi:hypothetical protein